MKRHCPSYCSTQRLTVSLAICASDADPASTTWLTYWHIFCVFVEFEINEETKEFLKTLEGPIGVLSVAGMYRSGKSYLLNRVLLNRSRGFDVGHTINACTKVSANLIKLSPSGIYQSFELQKCNFLNTSGDNLAWWKDKRHFPRYVWSLTCANVMMFWRGVGLSSTLIC